MYYSLRIDWYNRRENDAVPYFKNIEYEII